MKASDLERLERWELYGAVWRVRVLNDTEAVVSLCTCHGEPVDVLRSSDPEVLRYLAERPGSESPPPQTLS